MDPLRNAPLNGLRAVEAVARLHSLRAAAAELGVSTGAVSQQVARCEAALGRQLFERRPGGMIPVPGTGDIFSGLHEGFARIASAVELTRRDRAHILTISVAPIFAARWLIWRLPEFTRAHPDIRIRLESDIALSDPNTGEIDFAIRIGRGDYPGLTVEPLLVQYVVPVCSAELAIRIREPADFAHVPIIRDARAMFDWNVWLGPEGLSDAILGDGPIFNEASLGLDSAMAGEGVLLAFETLCHDALQRGQIVAPVPRFHLSGLSYWLVSARDRSLSAPQRKFRAWLREALLASGLGTR